jgi:hypothetical protein
LKTEEETEEKRDPPTKKNEKRQKEKTKRRTRGKSVCCLRMERERGKERKIVVTFCSTTETTVEVDTYTRKNVFHCIHCKHAKLVRVVQRPIFEQQNRNLLGGDDEKSDPVEILRQCRIGRKSEV